MIRKLEEMHVHHHEDMVLATERINNLAGIVNLQNTQFNNYASLQDRRYNTLHEMMETQNTNLANFQSAFMARFPPNQPVEPPQDNEEQQH